MATLEELVVSLTAETTGLRAELANASKVTSKSMKDMEGAIKQFSEKSGSQVSFFQTTMATMTGFLASQAVLGAINAVGDAFNFLKGELIMGAKEAIAEEAALVRLANSLALSGNYSREAQKGLQSFAQEVQNTTGISNTLVASNLSVLSSLTRLDAEGLKKAQQAALDYAAATGKDLSTATMDVAKAINGSTTAFQRQGIEIEKSTDKTQQFTNVLGALNSQFGGASLGAAQTFQGALARLEASYGDLWKEVGKLITQNPVVTAMMADLAGVFQALTGTVEGSSKSLKQDLGNALITTVNIVAAMAETMDTVFRGISASVQTLVLGFNTLADSLEYIVKLGGLAGDIDPFKSSIESSNALQETLNNKTVLGDFATALGSMAEAGSEAFYSIEKSGEATQATIANTNTSAKALVSTFSTLYQEQLKSFGEGLAQKNVLLADQFRSEQDLLKAKLDAELITEDEYFALRNDALIAQQEVELAQLDAFYATQSGKDAEYQNARRNLLGQQKLEDLKFQTDKTKSEEAQNKTRADNFSSTMGAIAQLSKSGNKELAAIGKAAAITQATIDGYAAVQKALAAAPPPFNFGLAALVGAATAMNVAKIAGVGLNKGGTVPGGGANRDTVPAMLTGGEEVVNRDTAEKLRDFLSEGGAAREINISVSFPNATVIGDVKSSDFGAMVIEAINEALAQGKSVGLVRGAVS